MIVLKFGGSSVADAACMRQVAGLVAAALPKASLVVLSAMGKTTNGLFAAAKTAEIAAGVENVEVLWGLAGEGTACIGTPRRRRLWAAETSQGRTVGSGVGAASQRRGGRGEYRDG